jgi:hypothetical protein
VERPRERDLEVPKGCYKEREIAVRNKVWTFPWEMRDDTSFCSVVESARYYELISLACRPRSCLVFSTRRRYLLYSTGLSAQDLRSLQIIMRL